MKSAAVKQKLMLVMLAELIFDNISDGLFRGLHFYHQLCIQALHRNLFEI